MKRSELKRRTPLRATPPAKAEVKLLKARPCANCKTPFRPFSSLVKWCSADCGATLGMKKLQRAKTSAADKAKAEDKSKTRAQLEALKTIGQLEGECRKIIQKIARLRDKDDGCISCHMGPNYGGVWHGSHYRAHGGCSSLQMHLWNVHKACAQCNLYKGGNKEGFIAGLLVKPGYGRERLEWLDNQPKSKRFERDYLQRFKAVMGKRARRMEKR